MSARAERLALQIAGADGEPYPLPSSGSLVVGSSPEHAGLVLSGQGVDPAHCAIGKLREGGWAVKDLGSAYGTLVNGERVGSRRLALDDRLVLGSRRLRVVEAASGGSSAARAEPAGPAPADRGPVDRPSQIGGYKIERLIGRGRMGIVYLALQESLGRPVALKVLDPALAADHEFVARFRTEAQSAAALNHPNVVVVHDVGQADGLHFLSMEYMPGESLEDELAKSGKLSWRMVLDVLHDAAAGLDYAEKRGIVHRDVKPANLMRSAGGTVKLADLGLATTASAASDRTREARVFGTPHFISPEQARGEPVDHRSDLYSLGATAYRLLTGRTPFEGATTPEILRAHFEDPPTPPRVHDPSIPQELESLVLSLLAKEPEARPPSASAVLEEVDRQRATVDAAGWGRSSPAKGSTKRLVTLLVASVAGAVALFVALLFVARRIAPELPAEPETPGTRAPGASSRDPVRDEDDPFFAALPAGRAADPYASVESRLATMDSEAREAFTALDAGAEPTRRVEELSALIERFPGTETAARMAAELATIREELRLEALRTRALDDQARRAAEGLRLATGWPPAPGSDPPFRDALTRLEAYRPPADVARHPGYDDAREALEEEITAAAAAALESGRERADELAAEGAFAQVDELLERLVEQYEPPELRPGEPRGFARLRRALDSLRARRAGLAAERARYHEATRRHDRGRIGRGLGPQSGFLEALHGLDFDALQTRLDTLQAELESERALGLARRLEADLASARAALDLLVWTFRNGEWRRRSIVDVASGRGTTLVTGASDAGLFLEGGSDPTPWSAFAARPEWLHQLFHERLDRDFTGHETALVAALLRLAATAEAASLARQSLRTESAAPVEIDAVFSLCDACLGPARPLEIERLAVERFASATRSAAHQSWSAAVAAGRRLLEQMEDSVFVALIADGSALDWSAAAPPPADRR